MAVLDLVSVLREIYVSNSSDRAYSIIMQTSKATVKNAVCFQIGICCKGTKFGISLAFIVLSLELFSSMW